MILELKTTIAELHTTLTLQGIDKKTLDSKLLESDIFQKLVIQVQAIVAYCAYLKQRTEKAEYNILEIEKTRAFELNDLQIKENQQKLLLVKKNKILEMEVSNLRDSKNQLQFELQTKINSLKNYESKYGTSGMDIEVENSNPITGNPNDPRNRAKAQSGEQDQG
jgi:hypothetical protein